MITKIFKMLVAAILQSNGTATTPGNLPVRATNGNTVYIGHRFGNYSFPIAVNKSTVSFASNGTGIHVGSGNTPFTEDDYTLDSPISSGLTASVPTSQYGIDENDNPYLDLMFTLNNTTNSDIVINEISYVQSVSYANTKGSNVTTNSNTAIIMLDRTVLSTPINIPAGETVPVKYRLKTILSA